MADIDNLPPELAYNVLLDLPYNDVVNYCQTSTHARVVCSEAFWRDKLVHDYGAPIFQRAYSMIQSQRTVWIAQHTQLSPCRRTVIGTFFSRAGAIAGVIKYVLDSIGYEDENNTTLVPSDTIDDRYSVGFRKNYATILADDNQSYRNNIAAYRRRLPRKIREELEEDVLDLEGMQVIELDESRIQD